MWACQTCTVNESVDSRLTSRFERSIGCAYRPNARADLADRPHERVLAIIRFIGFARLLPDEHL